MLQLTQQNLITPWMFSFRWFNEGKLHDGHAAGWLLTAPYMKDYIKFNYRGVVTLSVPWNGCYRIDPSQQGTFSTLSIMPVLFPGVIIGISTVVLWDRIATLGAMVLFQS